MAQLGYLLGLVFLVSCAACSASADECTLGTSCDGNVARVCVATISHHVLTTEDRCGDRTCIVAGNDAFCALGAEQDPRCGIGSEGSFCDGKTSVRCTKGFPVARIPCAGSCQTCNEAGLGATCVAAAKDAQCEAVAPPLQDAYVCEGDRRVRCACGFRLETSDLCEKSCVAPVSASGTQDTAFCALGADPRCLPEVRDVQGHLVETERCGDRVTLIRCRGGFLVSQKSCARGCEDGGFNVRPICNEEPPG